MTTIFISYRREDESGAAGRLYDALVREFGDTSVFMDVDGIAPGVDFVQVIEDVLRRADVMLAVIGRRWLEATDETGHRRLHDPADFVRLEIERALQRGEAKGDIQLLPICVEGARMPHPDELPPEMAPFARLQALTLSHVTWRRDMERLLSSIKAIPRGRTRRGAIGLLWRRPWRLAAALVVAAIALAGVLLATRSTDRTGTPARTSIGRIVGEPIPLEAKPTGIAAGADGVWVSELSGTVQHIDSSTGRVRGKPIRVGGKPLGLAVADGIVWVGIEHDNRDGTVTGTVVALDASSGRRTGRPIEAGAQPYDVAVGSGAVWTANAGDGSVTRIDPSTRKSKTFYFSGPDTTDVKSKPADVAVGGGAVWAPAFGAQVVWRISPVSGKKLAEVPVPSQPESITVGAGGVWVTSLTGDTVTKVDPSTNQPVGKPIDVGSHPDDLAFWQGGLYVAAKDARELQRIDPARMKVVGSPINVGNEPDALAADGDRLWVANAADRSVVQVRY